MTRIYLYIILSLLITSCENLSPAQITQEYFDLNGLISNQLEMFSSRQDVEVVKSLNYNGHVEYKVLDTSSLNILSQLVNELDINRPAFRGAYMIDETEFITAKRSYPSTTYRLGEENNAAVKFLKVIFDQERNPLAVVIFRDSSNPLYSLSQMVFLQLNKGVLQKVYIRGKQDIILFKGDVYELTYLID